jgi:hypothetical protein
MREGGKSTIIPEWETGFNKQYESQERLEMKRLRSDRKQASKLHDEEIGSEQMTFEQNYCVLLSQVKT